MSETTEQEQEEHEFTDQEALAIARAVTDTEGQAREFAAALSADDDPAAIAERIVSHDTGGRP